MLIYILTLCWTVQLSAKLFAIKQLHQEIPNTANSALFLEKQVARGKSVTFLHLGSLGCGGAGGEGGGTLLPVEEGGGGGRREEGGGRREDY